MAECDFVNQTELIGSVVSALPSQEPYKAATVLWQVMPPIIMAAGTVGNVFSMVIFRQMRRDSNSRSNSMSYFFSALALSDIFLQYTGLLRRWLIYLIDYDVRTVNDVTCKVHMFLVYLTSMTSGWFLMAMTLQRVASVLWPHRVQLLCTQRNAKVIVGVMLLFLVAVNTPLLMCPYSIVGDGYYESIQYQDNVSKTLPKYQCSIVGHPSWLYFYDIVFMWIDLVMSSLIPSTFLIIGNAVLAVSLARSVRLARQMTSLGTGTGQRSRRRAASSLTVTLMCLSVTYLVLTLPVCLYFVLEGYGVFVSGDDASSDAWEELAMTVVNLLWYTNASLNFYVYVLTGTKFRAQCLKMICPCRHQRARNATSGSDAGHGTRDNSRPFVISSSTNGIAQGREDSSIRNGSRGSDRMKKLDDLKFSGSLVSFSTNGGTNAAGRGEFGLRKLAFSRGKNKQSIDKFSGGSASNSANNNNNNGKRRRVSMERESEEF